MLCDKCKNHAAEIHYKQIENGVKSEMHLCPECAAEMGITGSIFSGGGLFSSFFGLPEKGFSAAHQCPLCGSTFSELCNTGLAGCPECYSFFGTELLPSIRSMHGRTAHRGRLPLAGTAPEKADPIVSLEAELQQAIEAQEYERAATLRDAIKAKREEKKNG